MNIKIIINSNERIICPYCGEPFYLKSVIAHQLIEQHEKDQKIVQYELLFVRSTPAKEAEKKSLQAGIEEQLKLKETSSVKKLMMHLIKLIIILSVN